MSSKQHGWSIDAVSRRFGVRGPVSAEAMAAITLAAMANPKATPRPLWNGAVIRCGKNSRPVT